MQAPHGPNGAESNGHESIKPQKILSDINNHTRAVRFHIFTCSASFISRAVAPFQNNCIVILTTMMLIIIAIVVGTSISISII